MSVRKMIAIAILLLLVLAVLLFAAWHYAGYRAVRAEVRAARDAGHPMSVEELRRWHPRPEESPHAGELYEQTFEVLERIGTPDGFLKLPYVGHCDSPPPGTPWPDDWFDRAEAYLAERAEAIDLIHQAASLGPAWFEIDWTSNAAMMPSWTPLRRAARLIWLEAEWHAQSGRTEEAVESVLTLWGIAEALADDPVKISQLSRWAFIGTAQSMTSQLLTIAPDLTPEQLMRVQNAIEPVEIDAGLHRAMVGGMASMHLQFQKRSEFGLGRASNRDMNVRRALGLYSRDHALYLRYRLEEIEWLEARMRGESPSEMASREVPKYAKVARMDEDHFHLTLRAERICTTSLRLARAGVAVARYRAEHGEYPDSLEALVPDYLDAVPEDPFSQGDPILYRSAETGVIVYSVGHNGVDHGGRQRNNEGNEDMGRSDTDFTFTLGTAQAELWPEQWPEWEPCEKPEGW